jgi:hypothetical protein
MKTIPEKKIRFRIFSHIVSQYVKTNKCNNNFDAGGELSQFHGWFGNSHHEGAGGSFSL